MKTEDIAKEIIEIGKINSAQGLRFEDERDLIIQQIRFRSYQEYAKLVRFLNLTDDILPITDDELIDLFKNKFFVEESFRLFKIEDPEDLFYKKMLGHVPIFKTTLTQACAQVQQQGQLLQCVVNFFKDLFTEAYAKISAEQNIPVTQPVSQVETTTSTSSQQNPHGAMPQIIFAAQPVREGSTTTKRDLANDLSR